MKTTISSASESVAPGCDDLKPGAAVELRGISLRFRLYGTMVNPTLRSLLIDRLLRRRYANPGTFWALQDVDLALGPGDRLGIVGPNGAGKTTLLKLIAGVYRPTHGVARVVGRIAPLIDISTGLNLELSGLENVRLMGAILGYSRRAISEKIDEIFAFAGVASFAHTPLKYYSMGMKSRLTFAIATAVHSDILLIDEVFGGGDASFVPRATVRLREMMDASAIVIAVSHNLELLKELVEKVIWIDGGRIVRVGPAGEVCAAYVASTEQGGSQPDSLHVE